MALRQVLNHELTQVSAASHDQHLHAARRRQMKGRAGEGAQRLVVERSSSSSAPAAEPAAAASKRRMFRNNGVKDLETRYQSSKPQNLLTRLAEPATRRCAADP